jgi:hypothetical protein
LRLLSLRPDDLLTILKMALSIDLRDSVSLFPPIQATRFLTFASVGLPPTEHISLSLSFLDMPKLNSPAHRYLCLRFKRYLATPPARLEARMDSLLSFPVGLFHPLQRVGLSRRSPISRLGTWRSIPLAAEGAVSTPLSEMTGPGPLHSQ